MHSALSAAATIYRVEVSGWDNTPSFFVEKSDLEWSESGEKLVVLHHELRQGTILFVRLLQPISPDRSHPVPYTAELVRQPNYADWEYRLKQIVPGQLGVTG
jgi:hypothetical protein